MSEPKSNDGALRGTENKAYGKQYVKFSFYKVHDFVRNQSLPDRSTFGETLQSLLEHSSRKMLTRTYSTVGTRSDTDFLIWQVADDLRIIQDWHSEMLATNLGSALQRSHSFLSMTMRSVYSNPLHPETADRDMLRDDGGTSDYLFVYPMVKTRAWYELSSEERQRVMQEHIAIGHAYHEIKINTTYSYGLDDQEFVVAFEGDNPGQFLALVRDLRTSESSSYTERDTPMFTCLRMNSHELIEHIGLLRLSS